MDASKTVTKPRPKDKLSDRDFELNQVRRRFSPAETSIIDGTILAFRLHPSDPDFPFDLDYLDCILQVPLSYPGSGLPVLNVKNKEMERGFQINVEQGFNAIVMASSKSTLLSSLNLLDRRLESLLTGEKANTIKLIANKRKEADKGTLVPSQQEPKIHRSPQTASQVEHEPAYPVEQRAAAASRRETETRQLEARLGRQSMFAKSSDGIAYTLPIEPRQRTELPLSLSNVKTLRLFVPMLYPLLPCRIALQGVSRDAAASIERAFTRSAEQSPELSLMGHINNLATNMRKFAFEPIEEDESQQQSPELDFESLNLHDDEEPKGSDQKPDSNFTLGDRTHLHVISRPPEWSTAGHADSDEETEGSDSQEYASSDQEREDIASSSQKRPERGVSLDLPHLELYGIELLELKMLSLTVKCLRCKETMDIMNLRDEASSARNETCGKCASVLNIGRQLLAS